MTRGQVKSNLNQNISSQTTKKHRGPATGKVNKHMFIAPISGTNHKNSLSISTCYDALLFIVTTIEQVDNSMRKLFNNRYAQYVHAFTGRLESNWKSAMHRSLLEYWLCFFAFPSP